MTDLRAEGTPDASASRSMTANVPVTFGAGLTDRLVGLATREVHVADFDLRFEIVDSPRKIFDRMAGPNPFDASEMSLSEFVGHIDAGNSPMVGLPAFTSRAFRHGNIIVNRRSVRKPEDLRGKRIGTPIYTTTAAVYMRALLQHEYGVHFRDIEWIEGNLERSGGREPAVLHTPVRLSRNTSEKSLAQLLADDEIQAIISPTLPSVFGAHPDVVRLFPNHVLVERNYYRRTGIFPIMHLVTLRRKVHERYPTLAPRLYDALCASKDLAVERMRATGVLPYMLPWLGRDLDELDELFGADPWPYGIAANRGTLDAFTTYLAEQGLTRNVVPTDDLFVCGT